MPNKIKVGFFSFVEVTDPAEHHSYNEWHQLDHMPEQYPIPGIAWGQRWVMTPACQAARAACSPALLPVHYVALYLMTEPVAETLREFEELGHRLGEQGRFHLHRRSHLFGAWHLLVTAASPRVLISAEAVPYRPCRGVYVVVEEPADGGAIRDAHVRRVPAMLDVPGVAGVWSFATTPLYRNDRWITGRTHITVAWLDEDPVTVAGRLGPLVGTDAMLAAPFETITPWEWSWFEKT